jgi:anti-sigma factor RsiW
MIRRFACLAPVVLMCACASRGAPPPDVAVVSTSDRIVTGAGNFMTIGGSATTVGIAGDVPAPPDDVFRAVKAVYDELKIPIADVSTADRAIGNQLFKTRRRIGGVSMQTYLDCGGNSGQPNAETFDIVMNVLTYVTAGQVTGSTVTTRLQAVGSDPNHGKDNQLRCASTGELEKRIAQMTREKVAAK